MKVIDSYARSVKVLNIYRSCFQTYKKALKDYNDLDAEASQSRTELDYLMFQYNQLEEAKLREGEQEELEAEQEKLTHAGEIKNGLNSAAILMQGEDQSVLRLLKESLASISKISRYLQEIPSLISRIDSSYIEIKDIAAEIERLNDQMNFDPARLDTVNERLNVIYDLQKKHRVGSMAELIALKNNLREKISVISSYDFNIAELKKKMDQSLANLSSASEDLSSTRRSAIPDFESRVTSMLLEVGMPNAVFNIEMSPSEEYTWQGSDNIRFLFTANRNLAPQDISKVASGGELSRLMLCIKSLMSDSAGLPTLIFDEIDTGVSGEIAERVGNIINRMSDKMQIINITHLPQVASKGKYHYLVYKTDEEKSPITRMKLLNSEERVIEIAKMLSGEEVTSAALENARVLLRETHG
jgi:DNA repair protein RecN (Recombination protein N)